MKHILSLAILFFVKSTQCMERHYYIGAVEVDWDYSPNGNLVSSYNENYQKKHVRKTDRISSKYRKVIYRQFSDPLFTKPTPVPGWQGFLGPTLRTEVGDVLYLHFRNMASIGNFSMHPHGLFYNKANEGALYLDGTSSVTKIDDRVPPGGAVTYIWFSNKLHAPTAHDDNCVAWAYHSHTDGPKDISTGLVGFLLNCRKGTLDANGHRKDVHREFPLYADIVDENDSYYIDYNVHTCGNPAVCKNLKQRKDKDFVSSNQLHHINGYSYGNLPPFVTVEGEKIVWYIMSLNLGVHTMHVNGQTMVIEQKRVDTSLIVQASFYSGYMQPVNTGRWLLYCRNQVHFQDGMQAFVDVKRNSQYKLPAYSLSLPSKISRIYYIAIEEILWNYAPKLDSLTAADATRFIQNGNQRIGSIYKKAVYREYTDATFTNRKLRSAGEVHYGLAGPPIRAEEGETVKVIVMNKATRPYSLLLNGVSITKENEGAYYKSSPFSTKESGAIIRPGDMRKYIFNVPVDTLTPLNDDCTTFIYHSAVDLRKDIHTGLFGPLMVCRPGTLSPKSNKQLNVDREFILNWMVVDENLSWYIDDNIQMFTRQPWTVNKEDSGFVQSNKMRAINGYSFGSLKGLNMCLGNRVKWHFYGLGESFDHHHFSFEGNNFMHDGKKVDAGSVFPGTSETVTMITDQAGRLLLRNGQLGFESEGMYAYYNVLVCTKKPMGKVPPPRILPSPNGVIRRYYIGVIEGDWDFIPVKRDAKTGASLLNPEHPGYSVTRSGPRFVGSRYYKAIYRQFTDESFTVMVPRSPEDEHLGINGPFIRGNVGDVIEIVLNNKASIPYNLVPRNVVFKDGSSISSALPTMPGESKVYQYVIPERSRPLNSQPNCIGTIYTSRVDPLYDSNAGLVGPFVICKTGVLDPLGHRTDGVTKEFALGFLNFDENFSQYKDLNFRQRAPGRQNYMDEDFKESNIYHSINGLLFGNLKGLVFSEGEMSAWYIYALGSTLGVHTVHFHGQLYKHVNSLTLTRDVVEVYPGIYETVQMAGYNPGTWLLHCHVAPHSKEGMVATYTVLPKRIGMDGSKVLKQDKIRLIRRMKTRRPQVLWHKKLY